MRRTAERSFFAVLLALSVTLLATGYFAFSDAPEPEQIVLADERQQRLTVADEFYDTRQPDLEQATVNDIVPCARLRTIIDGVERTQLDHYFAELDAVECEGTWRDVLNSMESRVAATSQSDPIAMLRTVFLEPVLINRAYAADLRAVSAPSEVQDAHRRIILAREESAAAYEAFARRLDGVADLFAAMQLFDDQVPGVTEAGDRGHAACLELVSVAERHGVETRLQCTQLHFVVLSAGEPPEDLLEVFPGEP